MHSSRGLLLSISLFLTLAACGPRTDLVIVLDKNGGYQAFGNIVKLAMATPGGIQSGSLGLPPGAIFVFRADGEMSGAVFKAGTACRVAQDRKLEIIGSVDLGKSNTDLARQFGVVPETMVSRPGRPASRTGP